MILSPIPYHNWVCYTWVCMNLSLFIGLFMLVSQALHSILCVFLVWRFEVVEAQAEGLGFSTPIRWRQGLLHCISIFIFIEISISHPNFMCNCLYLFMSVIALYMLKWNILDWILTLNIFYAWIYICCWEKIVAT